MSRPWKSELRVQLRRGSTAVQCLAPWSRQVLGEAGGQGVAATSLPQALAALRERLPEPLPTQARLLVPDELAYLSLVESGGGWAAAHRAAVNHFAATLGRLDLVVQVAAMPGGRHWLAAAIEPADLQAWQRALADAGVRLAHVELQLLDDLRRLAHQLPDDAIVALLRDEGSTLVRVARGTPVELRWERCDLRVRLLVEQRVKAFQSASAASPPPGVWLLCGSDAQHGQWTQAASEHGWSLLRRDARAAPAEAGE